MSMVRMTRRTLSSVFRQGFASYPREAVGVLIADRRTDPTFVDGWGRLTNVASDPIRHFEVSPAQQLALWAEFDRNDAGLIIAWHSHTQGIGTPSRDDIEKHDPALLLGLLDMTTITAPRFAVYTVDDGEIEEVDVEICAPAPVIVKD